MTEPEQKGGIDVKEKMGAAGTTVKEGVIGTLKGIYQIETQLLEVARNIFADTLKSMVVVTGEAITVTKDVLKSAISATEEVGTGLLMSVYSLSKGIVMGVSDVGGDVLAVARTAIQGMVKGAAEVGADGASVAKRAVDGIPEAAKETGANVQEMAKVAVAGAALPKARPAAEAGTGKSEQPEIEAQTASSIQENKVICLECSAEMKQLTVKHLSSHGLTIGEYKTKWGFPQKQSLSAKSLSKARSKAAKKRGLPEKLVKFQEQRKQEKMKAVESSPVTRDDKGKTKPQVKSRPKKKAE